MHGYTCKRYCIGEAKMPYGFRTKNASCTTCEVAYDTDKNRCYCCNSPIRRTKVGQEARHKKAQMVKRI